MYSVMLFDGACYHYLIPVNLSQCTPFVLSRFLVTQLLDVLVPQDGGHNLCSGRHTSMKLCACAMPCLDTRCLFQQRVQKRSLACTRSSRKRFPLHVRPWLCRQFNTQSTRPHVGLHNIPTGHTEEKYTTESSIVCVALHCLESSVCPIKMLSNPTSSML